MFSCILYSEKQSQYVSTLFLSTSLLFLCLPLHVGMPVEIVILL